MCECICTYIINIVSAVLMYGLVQLIIKGPKFFVWWQGGGLLSFIFN